MKLKIVESSAAAKERIDIAEYIAREAGFKIGHKFLQAVEKAYEQLSEMPGIGAQRSYGLEFQGLRMWIVPKFRNYLIFYRATKTELQIVRILHGMRNIESLLGDTEVE